ncbi:SAM-dependent methyltransferase [Erythrobacter ani]|uniref:Class I SAM-dependent methyltransferase n=1 Tax=Erythrobacter ani TaxID=2827235 RepID=A0ABS6SPF8_9SPHN|nr:cyclopropane-fatty-acyl-phospholipid synthase family protein [Erythrobacter ani]MBV7266915.1 class I SAM-dependent methyltransferase [Erythrobacter ani]
MSAQGMRGEPLLAGGARFAPQPGFLARLFAPGFKTMLDRVDAGLETGSLTSHLPDGTMRVLGGRAQGFDVEIHLKDWRALIRLATNGSVGWYQAYEAGEWEADNYAHLFALFGANARSLGNTARSIGPFRWIAALAHRFNQNSKAGSVRNIAAHYDLGNDFYSAWLDPSMTYSSGLGLTGGDLAASQACKLAAIADRVAGSETVLEIGCGWGSMARTLAEGGAKVTAISLSDQQLAFARAHSDPAIEFRKQDYRDVGGQFDAIASVEMVEALGREYWPDFMNCVARSLKPGGRAAIQYISMADDLFETYAQSADFIQAYVFPGGMLIKTSEFRALAEQRGLRWTDQTDFGRDYAATLRTWKDSFDRAVSEGRLPHGFDDRFISLWRYYLSYCEGGFLSGNIDVHQVTLVKD